MKFIALVAAAITIMPPSSASAQKLVAISGPWQIVNMNDGETCAMGLEYDHSIHSGVIFAADAKKKKVIIAEVDHTIHLVPGKSYPVTITAKSTNRTTIVNLVGKGEERALAVEFNDEATHLLAPTEDSPAKDHNLTLTLSANEHTYPSIAVDYDFIRALGTVMDCTLRLAIHPKT